MIRQKTILISGVRETVLADGIRTWAALPLSDIQELINDVSNELLAEINSNEALAFMDFKITHMWSDKHQERISVTIIYRETPSRKVLIEKVK